MHTKSKLFIAPILAGAIFFNLTAKAQGPPPVKEIETPKNWHQLDLTTDGYFGISLTPAYELVKGKKSKTVVVATIDSGIDTAQKDLSSILWVNPKEKRNGKDDDKNGYVDDIHGWNFLGGPGGKADYTETTEEVREYARLSKTYLNTTQEQAKDKKEFAYWEQVKATHDTTVAQSTKQLDDLKPVLNILMITSDKVKRALSLPSDATFKNADLAKVSSPNDTVMRSKAIWASIFEQQGGDQTNAAIIKELGDYLTKLDRDVNPDLTSRQTIVGDDADVWDTKPYGSNILKFPDASHGTGVAGLIGAIRNNGYGIDGVADNVRIMGIKAVPNGDEYDKDVAKAIRYAVDNGAKIINMSFGKKLSPHKKWVDDAFKYAASKDVLLVQAAGNDNQDVDVKPQFPNDTFEDGSVTDMPNVLVVGASAAKNDSTLAGSFSNYGQKNVDVFAPGVKVTSIDKDAEFNTADGTSFASPITAGVAALVLEYYPKLSAAQLKQVIIQSATPLKGTMVIKPGTHDLVDFTTLSKAGGIVNAKRALEIAATMKGERKN